jgi:hypothetical protein
MLPEGAEPALQRGSRMRHTVETPLGIYRPTHDSSALPHLWPWTGRMDQIELRPITVAGVG